MLKRYNHINKMLSMLGRKEKRNFGFVMAGAFFMAILQVVGVGSIMPFVSVASNPEIIRTNEYLKWAYNTFHFTSDRDFLIALGLIMLAFVIVTNTSMAIFQYVKVRFTSMRRHSISLKLLKNYLSQYYPFFLNSNSYDFIKNINMEIDQMVRGSLMNLVEFFSKLIQVLLMILFLFAVSPITTLSIVIIISGVYGLIYMGVRRKLKRLGEERFTLYTESTRVVSEAFWGIKEVKIMGLEASIINAYNPPSKRHSANYATTQTISIVPKFALEAIAFSAVIFYVLYATISSGNFQNAAASVSLYAYAGYRLMPAIQAVFKATTKMRYSSAGTELIHSEFQRAIKKPLNLVQNKNRMPFERDIELKNINFQYPNTEEPVIPDLSMTVKANNLIGFVGKTGSGKTTLVDIILGLLHPQDGSIFIDGLKITKENIREWQNNLGYVPQTIYLTNDTIEANIAFGVPKEKIDHVAVKTAAKMAQIHDFINSELKEGYKTEIGERGVRLSGGQRQRIGIARALYHNPSVLIMDEATSALDNETEKAVMDAIDGLTGKKTILLIAHRITTLKKCDVIYDLEKGLINKAGSYNDFYEN